MRRAILRILLVCSFLLLAACSNDPIDPETWNLSCYYLQSDRSFGRNEGVLGSEVRSLSQPLEDWEELLNGYLAGPSQGDLVSPFPDGLQCVETSLDDGVLTMVLSEPWEQLGGMSETLATACLTGREGAGIGTSQKTCPCIVRFVTCGGRGRTRTESRYISFVGISTESGLCCVSQRAARYVWRVAAGTAVIVEYLCIIKIFRS